MEELGVKELIREFKEESSQERNQLRKQINMMRVLMFAMAGVICILIVTLATLVPQISTTLDTANRALEDISYTASRVNEVFASVETLVEDSSTGVTEAIEKLNSINFEGLNQSIEDLGKVVSPLSEFFSRFR
ncbi:MAG: hypothetical protein MSS92_10685 [Lachnospiraceae bacterium]|nr:hypothetical protein [Lachnospiraceae bacterium]